VTPYTIILNISKFSPQHETHYFTFLSSPRTCHEFFPHWNAKLRAMAGVNRLSCQCEASLGYCRGVAYCCCCNISTTTDNRKRATTGQASCSQSAACGSMLITNSLYM